MRRVFRRESVGTRWRWYGTLIACVLAAYAVIWMFTDKTPFMHTVYCSYALQARRWLEGHLDLGENYPWLELAVYKGKYFVSFPPLPTLIVLPFTAALGVEGTPEYLITTAMSLVAAVHMLKLFDLYCQDRQVALLWALLATVGSNFLLIGYNGDVWLMAQTAAFMFTAAALYYAATDAEGDGRWPLLWLACAVGCRPLNIVYLPLVAWLLVEKFRKSGLTPWGAVKKHWPWLVAPALVGGFYMALNQLRFDSPFQFGHDYLPEFNESPDHVQFSLSAIPYNFTEKLFRLPEPGADGRVRVSIGGFAFFIASPIFGVGFLCLLRRVAGRLRGERIGNLAGILVAGACVSLHLLALCAHGSMGGVQWGLRYTIDAIPAAALGIMLLRRGEEGPDRLLLPALVFGLCLNLAGTLAILNGWDIFIG